MGIRTLHHRSTIAVYQSDLENLKRDVNFLIVREIVFLKVGSLNDGRERPHLADSLRWR